MGRAAVVTYAGFFCGAATTLPMNGWSQEFPRQDLVFRGQGPGFSLLLKRNCSISPSGLMLVYGLIVIVTMGIAGGFAALGAWLILPFAGIEVEDWGSHLC